MEDGRSASELDSLLQLTNRNVNSQLLSDLTSKSLVRLQGDRVHLTNLGRSTALEVLSMSKVAEEEAVRQIDHAEVAVVKRVLRQMIRTGLADTPAVTSRPR